MEYTIPISRDFMRLGAVAFEVQGDLMDDATHDGY